MGRDDRYRSFHFLLLDERCSDLLCCIWRLVQVVKFMNNLANSAIYMSSSKQDRFIVVKYAAKLSCKEVEDCYVD